MRNGDRYIYDAKFNRKLNDLFFVFAKLLMPYGIASSIFLKTSVL